MNRRDLIKSIALITGASVVGADIFLSGCQSASLGGILDKKTISLLDEIAETIIPATNTAGAKSAALGLFMNTIVSDCYTEKEQGEFIAGIKMLEKEAKNKYSKKFALLSNTNKQDLLITVEKEAKKYNKKKEKDSPVHYFTMIKQLTLWGFFTSKTGMTETLKYVPVPGKYQGDVPYLQGDKYWAE